MRNIRIELAEPFSCFVKNILFIVSLMLLSTLYGMLEFHQGKIDFINRVGYV
jgi:hypothetical protein